MASGTVGFATHQTACCGFLGWEGGAGPDCGGGYRAGGLGLCLGGGCGLGSFPDGLGMGLGTLPRGLGGGTCGGGLGPKDGGGGGGGGGGGCIRGVLVGVCGVFGGGLIHNGGRGTFPGEDVGDSESNGGRKKGELTSDGSILKESNGLSTRR